MLQKSKTPVIVSTGDPAGIGPIISVKSLNILKDYSIYLIGDKLQLEELIETIAPEFVDRVEEILKYSEKENIKKFFPSEKSGKLSFEFFEKAIDIIQNNKDSVLVTAPISKELWRKGGINYNGHTDYFDKRFAEQTIMFFYSDTIKTALFTHHIPLKSLWKYLTKNKIKDFIEILDFELNKRFKLNMKFASGSVNPHAGENGFLGKEEKEIIIPALEELKEDGIEVSGPFPNDTVFFRYKDRTDTVIISYTHDFALSPFKLIRFFDGVNLTLNLPFVRTSPDHGTGFDLKNKIDINEKSMVKSIELAVDLKKNERK